MTAAACPVCDGRDGRTVLEWPDIPVHCHRRWATADEARSAPRGDLVLEFCPDCGMLWNRAFEPDRVRYAPGYDNAQHYSAHFAAYLETLCSQLVGRHGLAGGTVLEIGCGDGTFLAMLCQASQSRGVGYDPSAPDRAPCDVVTLHRDLLPEQAEGQAPDLVVARHVLEHLTRPHELLGTVRRLLEPSPGGAIYLEVPNTGFLLQPSGVWDLLYEHFGYYDVPPLRCLVERAGFSVEAIETAFEGQFLVLHGRPGAAGRVAGEATELGDLPERVTRFGDTWRGQVAHWSERLERWHRQGRRVALWGAGTKGVMFLNAVPGAVRIDPIVDVSPRKQGTFVVGTGQTVVGPAALDSAPPDVVVVANAAYCEEIRAALEVRGLHPELAVL